MPNTFVFDITPQLTNIVTEIDANEAKIDLIRGTDVPNIQTNIDANETKIDSIIAAIPQEVRGTQSYAYLSNDTFNYADVLNLSGAQGKLHTIQAYISATVTDANIRMYCDNLTSQEHLITTVNTGLFIFDSVNPTGPLQITLDSRAIEPYAFNMEFSDSLRVEIKLTTGAGAITCLVVYSLDEF